VSDWDGEVQDIPEVSLTNEQIARLLKHNECLRNILPSVYEIKKCLAGKDQLSAKEAWLELDEYEQHDIWIAPSKGGIFTTKEREIIKNGFKEQ